MRYKNVKTGLTLVTDCKISGADFVLIEAEPAPKKGGKKKTDGKPKAKEDDKK